MTDPAEKLDAYLVGGAVRDQIMGLAVKDRDWVVVGATTEQMTRLGFKRVGKDFPVFLHPHSDEEFALARSERKTAKGYHGFEFHSGPAVTLEQDLSRRDLTMNAIAMDRQGNFVDPHQGRADIHNRLIRHVSDAFKEDPVRILRVARFAARFAGQGFNVAADTQALMAEMVVNGEVDALVAERVWQELRSCLGQKNCARFIRELRNCGALKKIIPELDALFGIPQTARYHPEIDTGIHTLMALDAADNLALDPMTLFAVMVHDLGKALTPESELPAHRGHERRGLKPINQLCDRFGVPGDYRSFALKVCEYHLHCHRIDELKPVTVMKVLERLDGFKKPDSIRRFALACLADKRGRTGHENASDEQMRLLLEYHRAALAVDAGAIAMETRANHSSQANVGLRIKRAIRRRRIAAIRQIKVENNDPGI